MNVCGIGVELQLHSLLTLALDAWEWSTSCPGRCNPGNRAYGKHWVEGWVCPIAGLNYGGREIAYLRQESIPDSSVAWWEDSYIAPKKKHNYSYYMPTFECDWMQKEKYREAQKNVYTLYSSISLE